MGNVIIWLPPLISFVVCVLLMENRTYRVLEKYRLLVTQIGLVASLAAGIILIKNTAAPDTFVVLVSEIATLFFLLPLLNFNKLEIPDRETLILLLTTNTTSGLLLLSDRVETVALLLPLINFISQVALEREASGSWKFENLKKSIQLLVVQIVLLTVSIVLIINSTGVGLWSKATHALGAIADENKLAAAIGFSLLMITIIITAIGPTFELIKVRSNQKHAWLWYALFGTATQGVQVMFAFKIALFGLHGLHLIGSTMHEVGNSPVLNLGAILLLSLLIWNSVGLFFLRTINQVVPKLVTNIFIVGLISLCTASISAIATTTVLLAFLPFATAELVRKLDRQNILPESLLKNWAQTLSQQAPICKGTLFFVLLFLMPVTNIYAFQIIAEALKIWSSDATSGEYHNVAKVAMLLCAATALVVGSIMILVDLFKKTTTTENKMDSANDGGYKIVLKFIFPLIILGIYPAPLYKYIVSLIEKLF